MKATAKALVMPITNDGSLYHPKSGTEIRCGGERHKLIQEHILQALVTPE
jgi:hypothetical protein